MSRRRAIARLQRQLPALAQLAGRIRTAPDGRPHRRGAKFFAAARSSAGPPTSIISTASSSVTPYRVATSVKG
jgi:hypothetical protein